MNARGSLNLIVGNPPIRAKMDLAAVMQHTFKHLPSPLHPGLSANRRDRDVQQLFTLGETFEFDEGDCLMVMRRKVVS